MSQKYFDIPFKTHSSLSDFSCADGEIEGAHSSFVSDDASLLTAEPPMPDISFAIMRDILPGWHLLPDSFPIKTVVAKDPTMEYWNSMASQILSQFMSETSNQNLFISPFLVMAAWSTPAGSLHSPSSPSLIIPNSDVPLVATDADISAAELEFKVTAAIGSLRFKMKAHESLRDFVGKISSLEILVSEPLHKYDTYHAFIPSKRVMSDSWGEFLDTSTGLVSQHKICNVTLPLAWRANLESRLPHLENFPDSIRLLNEIKFHRYASIPMGEIDRAESWCAPDKIGGRIFGVNGESQKYSNILSPASSAIKSEPLIIEGRDENIDIVTRPLKLTTATEFKKISRVHLRGNYSPDTLEITVYAGYDMLRWWPVAKRKGGTMVILPHSSFRFYKVSIRGFLARGENLQGLSVS